MRALTESFIMQCISRAKVYCTAGEMSAPEGTRCILVQSVASGLDRKKNSFLLKRANSEKNGLPNRLHWP